AFPRGAGTAFVATAVEFADGLVGGAAAGLHAAPLLLVDGSASAETAAELHRLAPDQIIVLGGSAAIAPSVVDDLAATTGATIQRLEGPDRYGTAGAVAAEMMPSDVETVYIASGTDFPDALVAGPAVAVENGALLLVTPTDIPQPIADALGRLHPRRIIILGGSEAVHDSVEQALEAYVTTTPG
ncbi:MAG: cell wall-binding repeat-containing protein, partial [Euzebyaceae bacterium]|nr:cell wall-binding repeat-containing protein [Euzebyaceae bacterium]